MGTILVNKYFEYLSLHPYWKKLNEEQKYIVFNKALRKLKPITKLEVGDIAKTYYEYDVYKSDFSKVKEHINLDEDNLNFILRIIRTKIKTAKYTTFTRDKVPEQSFKKNLSILINYIMLTLVKEIKSFTIFNTVSISDVLVKETIDKPFNILTNITSPYRVFDFLSGKFSIGVKAIRKLITSTHKYPFTDVIKSVFPLSFTETFSKKIDLYVNPVKLLSILDTYSGEFNIEVRGASNIEQEVYDGYRPNLTVSHLFIGV